MVGQLALDRLDGHTLEAVGIEHRPCRLRSGHICGIPHLEYLIIASHLALCPEHEEEARDHEDEVHGIKGSLADILICGDLLLHTRGADTNMQATRR